jgi:diguanylate cyclase (GGDEF)-like protein
MGDEQVTLPALENFIGANRKRLAFPTWLERQYAYDTSRRRCSRLRLYTQWTVLVYNLFLIPDWMLVPDTIGLATILHFAVVTPWMCFVAWLVGRETRTVVRESAAASVPIAIVVQILIIFWLNSSGDVGHYQYFVLLTVLFTNTVQRLPFSYAVAVSIGIAVLHSAVVIASGHLSASVSAVTITTLSAAACLTLISNYYLERDARRAYLQALRDRLRHAVAEVAAKRDALTDLGNRHHLAARIEALWQTQKGAALSVTMIMLDIDHFKSFNDRYGHVAGDLCLKRVASCVLAELRNEEDTAVRYGGEEILILLPDTEMRDAVRVAERIRRGVESLAVPHEALGPRKVVTASLGVAAAPVSTVSASELVSAADAALYAAKRNGRNQVWPSLLKDIDHTSGRSPGAVISIARAM